MLEEFLVFVLQGKSPDDVIVSQDITSTFAFRIQFGNFWLQIFHGNGLAEVDRPSHLATSFSWPHTASFLLLGAENNLCCLKHHRAPLWWSSVWACVLLPLHLHRPQLQTSGLSLNTDIRAGLLTVPVLNLLLLRPQLYEHAIPSPFNCNFLPRYPSRSFFTEPSLIPQLIFKKNSCGRMSATNTERPILSPRLLTLPLLRFIHPLVPLGSNQLLSVCVCVCVCVCVRERESIWPRT